MKATWTLLTALFLLAFQGASAQAPGGPPGGRAGGAPAGKISGTVVDAGNGEGIPSATVSVWRSADSTLATGALTDLDGKFLIEGLRPGQYYAQVSFVGFESQTVSDLNLRPGALEADLGTLRLAAATEFLEGVEVAGERAFVEVGIDRTVYNTRDQLVAAGGSATDVLSNIPSVEVDVDGNVSLRGNQNVAILINGRPAPMSGDALNAFLAGLPADQVERVEVIPNPSAKYEPDGMAGMLNIVLRQDRDLGLNGSVTVGADSEDNYNASGNLSYNKGKLTFNTSYAFRRWSRSGDGWRTRLIEGATDGSAALAPFLGQESWDDGSNPSHNFRAGVDYKLSKYNMVSFSGMLNRRTGDREGFTGYTARDAGDAITSQYNRLTTSGSNDWDTDFQLAFNRIIEASRHELTIELDQEFGFDDDSDRYFEEVLVGPDGPRARYETETNRQDEKGQETELQIDYIRPVGEAGRLEAGYKGSLDRLNSDFYSSTFDPGMGMLVPDPTDEFNYDIQIHAAYGTLGTKLGKFGMQGGLRAEQALTDFDFGPGSDRAFEKNYFSLFPSAYLTYSPTDTRTFKLAYSKRINRPRTGGWFNQLNPFSRSQDTLFVFRGNPELMPEYTHAFEASFTQFTQATSITLTPFYRRTVDVIRFLTSIDRTTGVTTTTFENLDESSSWGAELIGTLRLGQRMNGFASTSLYQVVTDGSNVDANASSNALGFSVRLNGSVNIRPGLDLQASYFYRAPMEVEFGRQAAQSWSDLALRQKLLGDRASLSLRVSDVFGTAGFHSWNFQNNVNQEVVRNFNAQRIGLTFQYNFGQTQRNNRRNRDDQQRPDMEEGGGGMEQGGF